MELVLKKPPSWSEIASQFPGVKALLFDMDGTLIPTEPLHEQAFLMMGKKYSVTLPSNIPLNFMHGMADEQVYHIVKNWEGFPSLNQAEFILEKNQLVIELLKECSHEHYLNPHLMQLLTDAKNNQCKLALVTSSERIVTEAIIATFQWEFLFDKFITRQDVLHPKPHPYPYQMAMNHFGVKPHECLIFEDSMTGRKAATASGAHLIHALWWY